jgi:SAM-dependent methyltransferase
MASRLRKRLDFNSSRYRLYEEVSAFALSIPKGAYLLDAGSGNQPYRELVQHTNYESADFEELDKSYAKTRYICDLRAIPVEDERYDYIFFNQVMEHLPEPKAVLQELYRVLKPRGKIFYSGPLFYEEHQVPFDYFRYTQFGLKVLFNNAGLVTERLEWLEGYFGTIAYQFHSMAKYLPTQPKEIGLGAKAYLVSPFLFMLKKLALLLSIFFHRLEKHTKYTDRGYPKNYLGIFVKSQPKL